ncbi:MAG: hypothetical protein NVSMB27_03410 [Ktedonobacteraceae bacterium]
MKENVVQNDQPSKEEISATKPLELSAAQGTSESGSVQVPQNTVASEKPGLAEKVQASRGLPARLQSWFEISLIMVGLYAMYKFLPHNILGVDAQQRFRAISELLEYGKMPTMKYSIVGPGFSIPFWLLGKIYQSSLWWCERYNLIVFASGLLVFYLLLKDRIDRRLLHTFILLLMVASMFGNHITNYYTEVFTAICVGVGILSITIGPALVGWCAIVLGVVNIPATMLGLCLMVLKHIFDNRRLRYFLAIAAALGLIIAESWIRRGNPFDGGYGGEPAPNFSFISLLSILFSFGKGLLFFAPGLLLPIRSTILSMKQGVKQELYRAYVLWICFLVGMVLVYSSWWAWWGGWFWGPRFFLFASIPATFALAVRLCYSRASSLVINLLTLIVFILSVWVGIDGAVFDQTSLEGTCARVGSACLYQPDLSALMRPLLAHLPITQNETYFIAFSLLVAAYLATPLLATIVQQTVEVAKNCGNIFLKRNVWHL